MTTLITIAKIIGLILALVGVYLLIQSMGHDIGGRKWENINIGHGIRSIKKWLE